MSNEKTFSLEEFIAKAHLGETVDIEQFCEWMQSFQDIVIWGAGNLGTAIADKLCSMGIKISAYWDAKWESLIEKNGIPVIETYSGDYDKEKTLIVFCIANVPVSPFLYSDLTEKKWMSIKGLDLLEGILCPFTKEGELDTSICNKWDVCTVCSCERLSNIMRCHTAKRKNIPEEEVLCFDRIHFIVNNMCNLKCTHCFMYMNSYEVKQKRNVDIEVMKRDINMLMEAIGSFGVVNVFGGEPFLHPDLDKIIGHILDYDNYGSIIVNTNGLANMKDKDLNSLKNNRIRLAFSNYLKQITSKQQEIFETNIERAREKGIVVGVQNELPTWNISSTLGKNDCSIEELKEYKRTCGVKFLYVHNGKLYPCAMCLSINDLEIEDYETDYVDISKCKNAEELKKKIIDLINQDYYMTCSHCDRDCGTTVCAGEQGFIERYSKPQ